MTNSGTLAKVGKLEAFATSYLQWLRELVDEQNRYSFLINFLFELEFVWVVERDFNRLKDGCSLRDKFSDYSGLECEESWIDWPCSILEMLIGLSYRIETVLYDPSDGDRLSKWFWVMVSNMGLRGCTDDNVAGDLETARAYICKQVDGMINRKYDEEGRDCALFRRPEGSITDYREAEIWVQANDFMMEKM